MFKILNRQILSPTEKRLSVSAKDIAGRVQPGQYVMLTIEKGEERIPLTVIDANPGRGTIDLVVHETGKATKKLGEVPIDTEIYSILGPLGNPASIEKVGVVVCVANGSGLAQMLPVCRALKDVGNKVIGILETKSKRAMLLESQMRMACYKLMMATKDGLMDRKGSAKDMARNVIYNEKIDRVYAAGSVGLLEEISRITAEKNIPTFVYLNPVLWDGTGECGSCRVKVGGNFHLACIDGPEFDGHKVDFSDLKIRMREKEKVTATYTAYTDQHKWLSPFPKLRSWMDEIMRT